MRWRSVVFASPNFLDIKLDCTPWRPAELVPIWLPFPIAIEDIKSSSSPQNYDLEAAIPHPDRVWQIDLQRITRSQFQQVASVIQKQFPALIHLMLHLDLYRFNDNGPALVLPDGLLGGCAPRLQSLQLNSIQFPALPTLLLSTTDLVRPSLAEIPRSGYLSPEEIVTSLGVLTKVEDLSIGFEPSYIDQKIWRSPSPTRTVFPALTRFRYEGSVEYIEDLVARIDTPLIDDIWITFRCEPTFSIPQVAQFMKRTTRFQALNEAHVNQHLYGIQVDSFPSSSYRSHKTSEKSGITFLCKNNRQPSRLANVFTSLFPSIYIVEHLYIVPSSWQEDFVNSQWLELFRPFTGVRDLYVSEEFIVPALQAFLRGTVTDVLPALENLYLEELGPVQEVVEQFAVARRLIGHPVGIFHWEKGNHVYAR